MGPDSTQSLEMQELPTIPFPVLTTSRLLLRALEITDAPAIFQLRSDPAVLRYLGREPATDIKEAEDFIRNIQDNTLSGKSILWGIALKENPSALIGTICFWNIKPEISEAESGYAMLPDFWGKGYTTESLQTVMDWGFNTAGFNSIIAVLDAANLPSAAVLQKTGFSLDPDWTETESFRGEEVKLVQYFKQNPLTTNAGVLRS